MSAEVEQTRPGRQATHGLVAVVGFLVCVELASGILQGYYTPIWQDVAHHLGIRDADVNWFEAAQLIVGALVIPLLARLGNRALPDGGFRHGEKDRGQRVVGLALAARHHAGAPERTLLAA